MTSDQQRLRLPADRVRSRISAYIYGDVLVLAAILGLEPEHHLSWGSLVTIVATALVTYLAHVVADAVGLRIGRDADQVAGHLLEELRDAVPIAVAGLIPAVTIALAVLHVLTAEVAQVVAVAFIVLRLAAVGFVTGRLTGTRAPVATVASGIGIAAVGAALAVVKAAVTH